MLVDTTVWVDHLRRGDPVLIGLLETQQVAVHPFVVGELACGHLKNRSALLGALGRMPSIAVVAHDDVLAFLASTSLMGCGLGWVDVHLLAAAAAAGERILTRDLRLRDAAVSIGIG